MMFSIHFTAFPGFALGVIGSRHSAGLLVACFSIELEWY